MKRKLVYLLAILIAITSSCTREATGIFEGEVVKEWKIPISAINVNPSPTGRLEEGLLTLQILVGNSVRFDFSLPNLNGEVLTGASINAGDPLTNGAVVLELNPRIASPVGSGIILNARQSLIDSLVNDSTELYFNLRSNTFVNGIARGQIHNRVTLAADVALTGANEVPPVTTTSNGVANIRLTANGKLYSKVTITNVEANDAFTAAHIHRGAPGVNGPILVNLVTSAAEFGINKIARIDTAAYNILMNEPRLYVNAHSVLNPAGKIRGQLR